MPEALPKLQTGGDGHLREAMLDWEGHHVSCRFQTRLSDVSPIDGVPLPRSNDVGRFSESQ